MSEKVFHIIREKYNKDTTLGKMMDPEGKLFGYTLEDIVRPAGVKVKKWTAIPATEGDFTYTLGLRHSKKYKNHVVVYTEIKKGEYILKNGNIKFKYILVHGGNTHENTSGCVLLAKTWDTKKMTIQGTLKSKFRKEVERLREKGYDVRLKVTNMPQKG